MNYPPRKKPSEDWDIGTEGIMAQNKSLKDVKSLQRSLDLSQLDYNFLDFGSSEGDSISFAIQCLGGTRGLGIDIDPKKIIEVRQKGYECIQGDFTQLVFPPDSVRFVTMNHVLEHLPDLPMVKKALKSAARVASDFLFIIGPYFDADQFLKSCGLKFFWSDWTGHKCHLTTQQLQEILTDLGLKDHVMMVRKIVKDSSDSAIHHLNSPKDQHEYNAEVHPEKPFVIFNQPIYKEIVCYVRLRPLENWEDIIRAVKGTIYL